MTIKLYNTASKTKEILKIPEEEPLGIYACGITAYDYAHIGNLRRYVVDDLLVRSLRYQGVDVKYVQNVTDVGHLTSDGDTGEDKLEKGSRRDGISAWDVARKYEDYYLHACQQMNITRPDVMPHATDYIDQQLKLVKDLYAKGIAYQIEDGIYFDTSQSPDYGTLAGFDPAALQEGARVDKVPGKRHPNDFALWKFEKPGENRQMVWPSPWGERTYPGWHTECVAMNLTELDTPVDIHTGGIDHIPVHHTNEIAIARAFIPGLRYVRIWLHVNFMRVDGKKMSKSLGNTYRLEDIIERGYHPMALRYLFLTSHYRHELNFTWDALAAAAKAYDRLVSVLAQDSQKAETGMVTQERMKKTAQYREKILEAINDDLDSPTALALIHQILKSPLTPSERYDLITDLDDILGLDLRAQAERKSKANQPETDLTNDADHQAQWLLAEREAARDSKDFARADYLRERIQQLGYQIIDTPRGPQLRRLTS